MSREEIHQIYLKCKAFSERYDHLTDGAFFAIAAEQGITLEDWEIYAEECERRKNIEKKK